MPTDRPHHNVTKPKDPAQASDAAGRRRHALEQTDGALTGSYDAGYLARLRDDWPT